MLFPQSQASKPMPPSQSVDPLVPLSPMRSIIPPAFLDALIPRTPPFLWLHHCPCSLRLCYYLPGPGSASVLREPSVISGLIVLISHFSYYMSKTSQMLSNIVHQSKVFYCSILKMQIRKKESTYIYFHTHILFRFLLAALAYCDLLFK